MLRADGIAIHSIKRAVAHHFGLPPTQFDSAVRSRNIARPRQIAMYLARRLTNKSSVEIGAAFGGRDHTTVLHAVQKVEQLRDADPAFDALVRELGRIIPERISLPAQLPPDLAEASRLAVLNVVRTAKQEPDGGCNGDAGMIRAALAELYDEEPYLRVECRDGSMAEMLVSPRGTWTMLHVSGDRARFAGAGTGIERLNGVVPEPGPDAAAETAPPESPSTDPRPKTRNCNRCGEEFVSEHAGHRRCRSCTNIVRSHNLAATEGLYS